MKIEAIEQTEGSTVSPPQGRGKVGGCGASANTFFQPSGLSVHVTSSEEPFVIARRDISCILLYIRISFCFHQNSFMTYNYLTFLLPFLFPHSNSVSQQFEDKFHSVSLLLYQQLPQYLILWLSLLNKYFLNGK